MSAAPPRMMFSPGLRRMVEKSVPNVYGFLRGSRKLLQSLRFNQGFQNRVHSALYDRGEILCVGGPFEGMRSFNLPTWASLTPKWLGTYELEVRSFVEDMIRRAPSVVVDVGCAEGYYVAGMALRLPEATVWAHDTDWFAQRFTARLASINGVRDRVKIGGFFDLKTWRPSGRPAALIVDIEGFEYELFRDCDPERLRHCTMLVEVHERLLKDIDLDGLADFLIGTFSGTHRAERTDKLERTADDVPEEVRQRLPQGLWERAMDEGRSQHTAWIYLTPLDG